MATAENIIVTEGAALCWSCNASVPLDAHFCTNCGKVQRPRRADWFAFFGLARKLNIDVPALEKEFYRLSRKLHPDLYARASAEEQEWSLEKTSQLNDAYRTLKDPVLRTQYLLELEGVRIEEQSSEATAQARESGEAKKQAVPPELLEEVFELNMQLQEMRAAKQMGDDAEDTARELQQAKTGFEQRLNATTDELKALWNEWDTLIARGVSEGPERAAARQKMVDVLNRRNYIRNLVRDVNAALA